MKKKSYVGHVFGRLTATNRIDKFNKKHNRNTTSYECLCSCGNKTIVSYSNLMNKTTQSCGCLRLDLLHSRKLPASHIRVREIYNYYERNAYDRNIEWKLTKKDVEKLVTGNCFYCTFKDEIKFIGMDRVNNNLGYTINNTVSCCKFCNRGKNDSNIEDFKNWIKRAYKYIWEDNNGNIFHE